MTEISPLKYIQWRPIGVCDTGLGKERKAKMFSRSDLAKITATSVNRGNWRQNNEIMKLIESYASDLAKLSSLTDGMSSPEILEIKLVGAVLGLDQTPSLNQESSEGRVQFFQVSFTDGKAKKALYINWTKWLKFFMISAGSIIALIIFYLSINLISKFPELGVKKNEPCSSNRKRQAYAEEINSIRRSLLIELSRLPEWSSFRQARLRCSLGKSRLIKQEQRFIQCYLTVRNQVNDLPATSRPYLFQIESCVQTMCSRRLPHLSSLCSRL